MKRLASRVCCSSRSRAKPLRICCAQCLRKPTHCPVAMEAQLLPPPRQPHLLRKTSDRSNARMCAVEFCRSWFYLSCRCCTCGINELQRLAALQQRWIVPTGHGWPYGSFIRARRCHNHALQCTTRHTRRKGDYIAVRIISLRCSPRPSTHQQVPEPREAARCGVTGCTCGCGAAGHNTPTVRAAHGLDCIRYLIPCWRVYGSNWALLVARGGTWRVHRCGIHGALRDTTLCQGKTWVHTNAEAGSQG